MLCCTGFIYIRKSYVYTGLALCIRMLYGIIKRSTFKVIQPYIATHQFPVQLLLLRYEHRYRCIYICALHIHTVTRDRVHIISSMHSRVCMCVRSSFIERYRLWLVITHKCLSYYITLTSMQSLLKSLLFQPHDTRLFKILIKPEVVGQLYENLLFNFIIEKLW